MKQRLRSSMYRSVAASLLGCGMATALVVFVAGEFLFREVYGAAKETGILEASGRFAMFDYFVAGADSRMREAAERALLELGIRYRGAADIATTTAAGLRAEARALGISDIYLVRANGHIGATSFEPDFGLDLFSFTEQTAAALRSLFGAGRVAHQSPSQSVVSGAMGSYHYYSPPGSDILIEVSTSLRASMAGSGAGGYEGFLDLFLGGIDGRANQAGAQPSGRRRPLVLVTDLVGLVGGRVWSFVREGVDRPELYWLAAIAQAEGTASDRRGLVETLVIQLDGIGDEDEIGGERRFAVLEVDHLPIRRFRLVASATGFLACAVSALLAFLSSKGFFDRVIAERVERLEASMSRISEGTYDPIAADGDAGGDEIDAIARGAAALVRAISARGEELAASLAEKEELLREIHHRVKNNLQLITSLIGLQIADSRDDEAVRVLEETRTRVHGMAVVHDRLYEGDSLALVDLGSCLVGIAEDIGQKRRKRDLAVEISIEAAGIALPADRALPVGLVASELIVNCYEHAFAGRPRGRIAVRAHRLDGDGFELSVEDDGAGAGPGPLREGLGLSIARALAAQLGGELRRESPEGGGERFVLSVPAPDRA